MNFSMHPTNRITDFVHGGFPLKVAVTSDCRSYQNYSGGENEEDELGETRGTPEMRNAYGVPVQNLKERDHLEDLGADGKVILQRILKKQAGKARTGVMWHRIGKSSRLL